MTNPRTRANHLRALPGNDEGGRPDAQSKPLLPMTPKQRKEAIRIGIPSVAILLAAGAVAAFASGGEKPSLGAQQDRAVAAELVEGPNAQERQASVCFELGERSMAGVAMIRTDSRAGERSTLQDKALLASTEGFQNEAALSESTTGRLWASEELGEEFHTTAPILAIPEDCEPGR